MDNLPNNDITQHKVTTFYDTSRLLVVLILSLI